MEMAAKAQLGPCLERIAASGADPELRELCEDCLRPASAARPRHAGVVAERMDAYLAAVEERARSAQILAAEERVSAAAARRSQRLTVALAAAGLLLLAVGGGGSWWVQHAAASRRSAAALRVASALGEAGTLLGAARATGDDDPAAWDRAVAAAEAAVGLAGLADVPEPSRKEARSALEAVEREREDAAHRVAERTRDERLREQVSLVRIPLDEGVRDEEWPRRDAERMDRAYDEAFSEYLGGTSLLEAPPPDAVAVLGASDDPIEIAAALDHWGLVRDFVAPEDDPAFARGTENLRRIVARLDVDDAWRTRLRTLLPNLGAERERLEQLATGADVPSLPATSLVLLGEALWLSGARRDAVDVYRRARELHPSDFGICIRLGILLRQLEPPPLEEVVEVFRIANALRPGMHEAQHLQILALEELRWYDNALRLSSDLLRGEPESPHWWLHVNIDLSNLHRWEELLDLSRRRLELQEGSELSLGNRSYLASAYRHAGNALRRLGRLEEALEQHRLGLEVVEVEPQNENLRKWADRLRKDIEGLEVDIAERPRLLEVLAGSVDPASAEESGRAAKFAYEEGNPTSAARAWREGFSRFPELETDWKERYDAACAAALCGVGIGRDVGDLGDAERAAWRHQALVWLRSALEEQPALAVADAEAGRNVLGRLRHWLGDVDLAGVREPSALAELPEDERMEWHLFWARVRAVHEELQVGLAEE